MTRPVLGYSGHVACVLVVVPLLIRLGGLLGLYYRPAEWGSLDYAMLLLAPVAALWRRGGMPEPERDFRTGVVLLAVASMPWWMLAWAGAPVWLAFRWMQLGGLVCRAAWLAVVAIAFRRLRRAERLRLRPGWIVLPMILVAAASMLLGAVTLIYDVAMSLARFL